MSALAMRSAETKSGDLVLQRSRERHPGSLRHTLGEWGVSSFLGGYHYYFLVDVLE